MQKAVKKVAKDRTRGTEHGEQQKKPAWLATSPSEYDDDERSTGDELDELASGGDEGANSSDEDVIVSVPTISTDALLCVWQVVESSKDKGKATQPKGRGKGKKSRAKDDEAITSKGDSRGRAMLRELPNEVRSVVNRASMFLRLRISLENAWTAEKKYGHTLLPEKHAIIKRALNDVRELCDDDGKPLKHIALGFKMLNDDKNEELRQDVFDLVHV